MTKEQFENNTSWKMTFEEYQKCDCMKYSKTFVEFPHRKAFRRAPRVDGGLGLCPNLKES